MKLVRYTRQAREDLLDIWAHIALQHPRTADQICDRIEASCRRLMEHPQLGPARPEIGDGARMLVVDRWLALYRLMDGVVQVVRIVDGVRDLKRLDWPIDGGEA